MPKDHQLLSPSLKALHKNLKSGNTTALDDFWNEILQQGTPLVEPIEGEEKYSFVTFLWRSDEIRGVSVISLLTNPTTYPMNRLLDTDLWYMTCRVRKDVRTTYQFSPIDPARTKGSENPWAQWRSDPHNPKTFAFYTADEDPTGMKLERSILELENAPEQPWIAFREKVPRGEITLHHLTSEILGNERRVWVYTPPGYPHDRQKAYALLILFDGWGYLHLMPTPTILDNLISAGRIPPMIAVFVDSLSLETRLRELVYHDPFNDFLIKELLPWIQDHFQVSSDRRQNILGGSSAGGLAAVYAGLKQPETFGKLLSQSGAFRLAPPGEDDFGWLARQFIEREKLPLRFHIDVGTLEENSLRDLGDGPSLLASTRHMHDVLRGIGYEVDYHEFSGGHDTICWQGTLSRGLQSLLNESPG
jgi:enterochelin esterase family protein